MAERRITWVEWCRRPEEKRKIELIDGRVVVSPMATRDHQRVVKRILIVLGHWVEEHGLGEVLPAPLDCHLDDYHVLQPDVFFVARASAHRLTNRALEGPPDVAIEVLSPSTARFDRGLRRRLYKRFGVREYWIVDHVARSVLVLSLEKGTYRELHAASGDVPVRSQVIEGFSAPARAFFRDLDPA